MLRGHIAHEWSAAYCQTYEASPGRKQPTQSTISKLSRQWSTQLILQLWQLSQSVWSYRNAVVHGRTEQSRISKERLQMQSEVCRHYSAYHDDPHYIPQNRTYLFASGEQATLAIRRDAMASWLALVDEAVRTQQHRQTANSTKITQYFVRRVTTSDIRIEADLQQAPFSAAYYRRHLPNEGRKVSVVRPSSSKPCQRKQRQHHKGDTPKHPSTTLFGHGFQRQVNKAGVPGISKRQRDAEEEKSEYSGTFLSTVP